jgi:hypothetical protein
LRHVLDRANLYENVNEEAARFDQNHKVSVDYEVELIETDDEGRYLGVVDPVVVAKKAKSREARRRQEAAVRKDKDSESRRHEADCHARNALLNNGNSSYYLKSDLKMRK